jgi:hypothetical protein
MAHATITPFRLGRAHKIALAKYLKGTTGIEATCRVMGLSRQRIYTMVTHMTKHSCTTGRINIEEVLKDY